MSQRRCNELLSMFGAWLFAVCFFRPTSKQSLILFAGLALCALMPPFALATTNSGIDTPQGVTSLPFAIQGNEMMELGTTGLAIGTSSAAAPLDVYGGIRGSDSAIITGGSCSPEGMFGYDMTNHGPVYCSSLNKWTSAAALKFASVWIPISGWGCGTVANVDLTPTTLNASYGIPTSVTSVEMMANIACNAPGGGFAWMDTTQCTNATDSHCFAMNYSPSSYGGIGAGSITTTPATHEFGSKCYGGGGGGTCTLAISGYYY